MKELKKTQEFEVEVVLPYDFSLSIEKEMAIRKMDSTDIVVDIFDKGVLWTGMYVNGQDVGLRICQEKNILSTKVFSASGLTNEEEKNVITILEHKVGPHEDITPFYERAERDDILSQICRSLCGMRKISCSNLFDMLSITILLQNAPVKRTNQMIVNLVQRFGSQVSFDNKTLYLWFTPETIDAASMDVLKNECRLGYRAPYLKSTASALLKGYDLESVRLLPTQEAKEKLMELKGIGPYSAEMVLLDMRRYDVFPVDAWSVQIYWNLYFPSPMPDRKQALERARDHAETSWGPWMGLAWTYIVYSVELGGIRV